MALVNAASVHSGELLLSTVSVLTVSIYSTSFVIFLFALILLRSNSHLHLKVLVLFWCHLCSYAHYLLPEYIPFVGKA